MSLLEEWERYRVHFGDCITHMAEMPPQSVDLSVFSPPFPSVYAYTSSEKDIGNSEDLKHEAKIHLSFFYRQLKRIVKPGRVIFVHVQQIPRMKRSGEVGLFDFRGLNIRLGERSGLVYEYDWLVPKNPQAQAIRTKSRELQFVGLEADRAKSRGSLADYLIKFRVPGDNAVPIDSEDQVSRNDWIQWAESAWYGIRETKTLNVKEGRGEDDTKHICLSRGSLVLTRKGYIPIETVEIGDMVLTHRGRWRPVLAKSCNGFRKVIKTEAQGVPGLYSTPDHRLWVRSHLGTGGKGRNPGTSHHRKNAKKSIPKWVAAEDSKGSYLNLPTPDVEESSLSEEDWWLIGRWLGDGHYDTKGNLHVTCSKVETDDLVKRMGERAGAITRKPSVSQIWIKDRDARIRKMLTGFGRGCEGKTLPVEALSLSPELSESLLSGYLSADGHYVKQYNRWTASSVSRPLLLGMAILAQRSRGVVASVYAGRGPGECTIEGRTMKTQQEWILSIPSKNLSAMVLPDGAWKKSRKITKAGESEVWDIQVQEDESFVAEGCVVHNCPLQLDVIERAVKLYSNPGEIVFSPFTGIGSEGYESVRLGRRFYGCELKPEYHAAALLNLKRAETAGTNQISMFAETV